MKQSLEDQLAADTKDMDAEKAAKESAIEEKAAADHEATVAARTEELKVIATAEKILKESTSRAVDQTYSLLQVASGSQMKTRADLANSEVVTLVKKLAKEHHSAALAQLASRIAVVARYGSRDGADPFAKVKGLISDMITKLEKEAEA